MKATEKQIKEYFYNIFLLYDFDYNEYIKLKNLENECIAKGELIFFK